MISNLALSIFIPAILAASTSLAQTKNNTSKSKPVQAKSIGQPSFTLSNEKDSLSYALGLDIYKSLRQFGKEIDIHILTKALNDAANSNVKPMLNEDQIPNIIQSGMRNIMERRNEELKKVGLDFLEQNKLRPDVKVTAEGVQYEIITEGTGKQPSAESNVLVHYKGTLVDGTQFDSSYDRNEPLELNLDRVIEGWKIGIPLMKEGSKYKFYIPHNLAYGERGSGLIPGYSTLIFEVELLEVKSDDAI